MTSRNDPGPNSGPGERRFPLKAVDSGEMEKEEGRPLIRTAKMAFSAGRHRQHYVDTAELMEWLAPTICPI